MVKKITNEKNYVSIEFSRKVRRIFAIYWHYQYNYGVYFFINFLMKKLASVLLVPALLVNAVGVQSIFEFMPTAHAYTSAQNPVDSNYVRTHTDKDNTEVNFEDPNLKIAINEVLSHITGTTRAAHQKVTIGEMKTIRFGKGNAGSFDQLSWDEIAHWSAAPHNASSRIKYPQYPVFAFRELSSLEGLQYLVNTEDLNLSAAKLSSSQALEPLKDLTQLKSLNLYQALRDGSPNFAPATNVLEPLKNLSHLENLHLNTNKLTSEHVAFLKDVQNLKTLLVSGNKILDLKTAFNSGGFANLGGNSAFENQQISLDTTKRLFENPLKDYNGNVIPVIETANVKNVDANGSPKQDGGYIKILNLNGVGNAEIKWSQPIGQYGNQKFTGTIALKYNLTAVPEFESITESIENATKIFAKTDDKIKVSLNLKQPATWKAGNTLEYCIGDDTSCAASNGANYQNIGAFTKADTPEKTRNKTITVPAGVNGHLYYRNIAFQNKDGENMERNPTDGNKNYFVKTILVDTKVPTCGTPTYNPTTPTNGNVTVTFVPQDDGSGLATSTQTRCTISKNNESCEFKIFDKAGNEAICKSSVVTNIDTEKPVITGDQTKTFEVGSDDAKNFDPKSGIQTEAGANLTCAVNPAYDATKTGTYTVKCKAKDAAGNDSDEFVRTITINPIDKTPLNNKISDTENLLQTDKKIVNDANKTALRNKLQDAKTKAQDQNLTKKQRDDLITEITDLVNKLTRDTQAPDLNLNDITVNEDVAITPIDLKQATNNDDIKEFTVNVRLPANATPDFSLDNATKTIVGTPKQPGIYEVTVTAEDQYENKTTKTFKITVKDTTKPEITLNGSPTITLVKGQPYNELGATCTDNYDATCNVVTTGGPVDSNTLGKTIITYTATDAAGNTSTKTREVTIVSGNTPVITLMGNSPVNVELGDTYTDGGATANDAEDGDLTAKIKKTGTVDTSRVGTYEISYDVTDSSGNKAPTVKRQIIVKDTTKPTISPVANTEVDEKNPITPIDIVVTDNDSQLTVSFVTTDANGNATN